MGLDCYALTVYVQFTLIAMIYPVEVRLSNTPMRRIPMSRELPCFDFPGYFQAPQTLINLRQRPKINFTISRRSIYSHFLHALHVNSPYGVAHPRLCSASFVCY